MEFIKKLITFVSWLIAAMVIFMILSFVFVITFAIRQGVDISGFKEDQVKTEHAVGVINLSGEIISSDSFVESLNKGVDAAKIKALVVRIESPGGSVAASEEIYRAIKEADAKKPVVCSLGNVAASGGLYSALGCRKIVANEGTLTGSVGVILMMPNVTDIIQKLGFDMTVIKSGKLKDSGSPFRKVTDEDKEFLQGIVSQSYMQFIRAISEARKIDIDEVKKFSDGRIILGEKAKELGIIDEIGGIYRSAKLALEATGDQEQPEIIKYKKPSGLSAVFSEVGESSLFRWISSFNKISLLYM